MGSNAMTDLLRKYEALNARVEKLEASDKAYFGAVVGNMIPWSNAAIGAAAINIVADGINDVAGELYVVGVAQNNSTLNVSGGIAGTLATPGMGSVTLNLFVDGGDTLTLTLYSTGRLDISNSAGANTFRCNIILWWV